MSPRKPAVLRDGAEKDLRGHLIATAARLIVQRGTAGLSVRAIAREAGVADGVLYNYFEDKEDLLAHAMLAHIADVMGTFQPIPAAGTGTVDENLQLFIDRGLDVLSKVSPAFAGLLSQPTVLTRFHAMVGGDAAFGTAPPGIPEDGRPENPPTGSGSPPAASEENPPDSGARGLPDILSAYLRAEQRLGRVDPSADADAVTALVVGAIHGQVLAHLFFSPPGDPVPAPPPALAMRLAATVISGIAPRPRQP